MVLQAYEAKYGEYKVDQDTAMLARGTKISLSAVQVNVEYYLKSP